MIIARNFVWIYLGFLALPSRADSGQRAERWSPDEYKEMLSRGLDEVARRIPPRARRQIEFGMNLFIAHEIWIGVVPQDVLIQAIDACKEAGIDRIDINPGQYPWLGRDQNGIAKYDTAIDRIRRHGLKLALNPQYSPAKHQVKSFDEWRRRALSIYAELARRYKPDIFVVVHEPTTMSGRMNSRATAADWAGFIRETARVVKQNSPGSRIGAGGLASEREYLEAFLRLPETEVLTLDIYRLGDLRTCNRLIREARAAGKPVYIEETWRPPYFQPRPGMTPDSASLKNVGSSEFEALDGRWLRVITAWAQANRLEAITPVWIFALFRYVPNGGDLDDPAYNRAVVEAILRGERTGTFRALQELVRENQALPR